MSSIGPTAPLTGPAPLPSASPATTAAPVQTAPTYLQSFSGLGTAVALGLAVPRNLGDTEALFAEISTKLDATRNKADDNEEIARTASKRTEIARMSSLITLLSNFSAIRDIEKEAEVPIANRAAAATARDAAQGDVDRYTAAISDLDNPSVSNLSAPSVGGRTLRGSVPYETAQVNTATSRLDGLVSAPQASWPNGADYATGLAFFLGAANPGANPSDIAASYNALYTARPMLANAQAERAQLVTLRDQAQTVVDTQQAEFERWDAIAAPLEADIQAAKDRLPDRTTDAAGVGTTFSFADLMTHFAALMPIFASNLLSLQVGKARETGETTDIVSDVDQNLEDIIDQIRDIDYERLELQFMSRMSEGDPGGGVSADASGSAFGGLSRAEALAMAFGGVILGAIQGLSQIAEQGGGGFGSAGSLAEAGAARTRLAL